VRVPLSSMSGSRKLRHLMVIDKVPAPRRQASQACGRLRLPREHRLTKALMWQA
jgi:hypothetical protein